MARGGRWLMLWCQGNSYSPQTSESGKSRPIDGAGEHIEERHVVKATSSVSLPQSRCLAYCENTKAQMMSYSSYGPVDPYSPIHYGDEPRASAWSPDGDLGSPDLEMRGGARPGARHSAWSGTSRQSTSSSSLFPKPGQLNEEQSFLDDPMNQFDTNFLGFDAAATRAPFKDHSARQLRHLLLGCSVRFLITFALCAAYVLALRVYKKKGVIDERHKKLCNAWTTGISIALGLNIASSFKDLALNMRWPILSLKKRNLLELNLILGCDSLTKLARLALLSRRPLVIFACLGWLFINILAQTGIAMLSLTYGFESDYNSVIMKPGIASIPKMEHFYPWGNNTDIELHDEQYTAHLYGGLAYNYGLNETKYMPKAGDIYQSSNSMLWYDWDANRMDFIFSDSLSTGFSIYTNRTISVTYSCDAHRVIAGGDGNSDNITVEDVGEIFVAQHMPASITFFTTSAENFCGDGNPRCSVVEVFEAFETESDVQQSWYYKCNTTIGKTQNDPHNISQINDDMAFWATSSIAQVGYRDEDSGQEAQIYPKGSLWGVPLLGDTAGMGNTVATFALGSIAGASMFNPARTYRGLQPSQGFLLEHNHPIFFYLILGLICGCQLIFVIIVSIVVNNVQLGPDDHLSMAMLLRNIADALYGVSGGEENKVFQNAKKNTLVVYEKTQSDKWQLSMTDISRMT
ncbi:hypothetical protein PVAG01_01829 [Phlyctema vagabunda]|uniref:Uncharacterized protein n=1 Tax=Phlyctema vagabunda TaxID=108571 RepID=A0ABR4PY70_9HELO